MHRQRGMGTSLSVAFASTNHDSKIAGSCFLNRVRPSNSDDSKKGFW